MPLLGSMYRGVRLATSICFFGALLGFRSLLATIRRSHFEALPNHPSTDLDRLDMEGVYTTSALFEVDSLRMSLDGAHAPHNNKSRLNPTDDLATETRYRIPEHSTTALPRLADFLGTTEYGSARARTEPKLYPPMKEAPTYKKNITVQ